MGRTRPTKDEFDARCNKMTSEIKDSITSGRLKAGAILLSESGLMNKYQLSRNSVRKLLSEIEEQGYIKRNQGQGSVVLPVKITPERSRHPEVVIISQPLYNVENETFGVFGISMIRSVIHFDAIVQMLHESGLRSRLLNYRLEKDDEKVIDFFRHCQPAAVIILTKISTQLKDVIDTNVRMGFPAVSIVPVKSDYITNFRYDDHHMGTAAADHAFSLGHKNVAIMSCCQHVPWAEARIQAFVERYNEHKFMPKVFLGDGDYTDGTVVENDWISLGRKLFNEHLRKDIGKYSLIFCVNDLVAYGAIKAAEEAKINVPEDISIMGCANDSLIFGFDMTSVNIETFKSGRFLAQYAIQRLSDTIPNLKSVMINVDPLIVNHTVTVKDLNNRISEELNQRGM